MESVTVEMLLDILDDSKYCHQAYSGIIRLGLFVDKYPILKDIILEYLDRNPDKINNVDDDGWSLLFSVASGSSGNTSIELTKELIERGIDVNIISSSGNSILTINIDKINNLTKTILKSGKFTNISRRNDRGYTIFNIISNLYNDNKEDIEEILDIIIEQYDWSQITRAIDDKICESVLKYIEEEYKKKYIMEYSIYRSKGPVKQLN